MKIFNNLFRKLKQVVLAMLMFSAALLVTNCSDDVADSNYYTFTGEMMGQYLENRPQFSDFVQIVNKANMMDLFNTYGSYTCFAPTNEAVEKYLQQRGLTSVDQLSKEDCDTLACSHLVKNLYTVTDMKDGVLTTPNMNSRYLDISHGVDSANNAVVFVNEKANIIFALQDDSVENGIMQPVNGVLTSSNNMLVDILKEDTKISLFNQALEATGLDKLLYKYKDESWNPDAYERIQYESDGNKETATVPDEKKYGYTVFAETDSILKEKYGITTLEQLYNKACEIYDPVYGDADQPYHSFDQITNENNPLYRFMAYHILNRNVIGWNYLTPLNDITIDITKMNPEDWYETLLPHTMINIQKVTVMKYLGTAARMNKCINRRYDESYQIEGSNIQKESQSALNGIFFHIDDIIAFSKETQQIVDNRRIRMDMSTVFPELMTNGIRLNGNAKQNDSEYDTSGKYGRNYYFPDGYLKDVTVKGGNFIYRRPRDFYWSYEGDEFNILGEDYDVTFKLPPVPESGTYQIRLGYAATTHRGIGQVYVDGKPQGIPLDMRIFLDDASVLGSSWAVSDNMTDEEKKESQKILKNKGYYRGSFGAYFYNGQGSTTYSYFYNQQRTFRIVLCTLYLDAGEDHYLRFKNVSKGEKPELMLDYLELVPKSVYGVSADENVPTEDDL
nr:fasciclin domain-containing protein [Prevotella sp.]